MPKCAIFAMIVCSFLMGGGPATQPTSPATQPTNLASPFPATEPTILPPVIVYPPEKPSSITSPTVEQAARQKSEIPGGFTLKSSLDADTARASNFEDLLHGIPGLFLQSENNVEVSKISMRGSGIDSADEPLGVEFLLDGMSFQQGDGEVILEDFDIGTIKYAEVFRGANALQFGALTLGGAVNLVPYTGYDAAPLQIRAETGSFGFVQSQISTGGVDRKLDWYVSLSGRYRDGYRVHSRENTEVFFTDLGYKFNDNLENRLYFTEDQTNRQLPGAITKAQMQNDPRSADPFAVPLNYNKIWNYTRIADKLSYSRDDTTADAGIYYWHRDLAANGFYSPVDLQQGVETYTSNNAGVDFDYTSHAKLFGQRNVFTIGLVAAMENESDKSYANLGGGDAGNTIGKDQELSVNVPFYAQNQHYLTDKLSLVTGIQLVYALRKFSDQFNNTLDGNQSATPSFYGYSPKLGAIYEFNKSSQAFLNFSGSWQPPSFDNMVTFDDGADVSQVFTPLHPQKAWTLELGTRGNAGRFDWDLALYRSWIRNELLDLYDAAGNDRGDVNVNSTIHQGIELGLGIELLDSIFVKKTEKKPGDSLKLQQTYTFNDFHFANDAVYHNSRIGAIPVHLYEADLMYGLPSGFYCGPNVQCSLTSYPVDMQNTLNVDPYALLGFKIGFQARGFEIFLQAVNLTNQRYPSSVDPIPNAVNPPNPAAFHPGDARSFYGGISYRW